ncbi:hypothetical protein PQQ59_18450 [Paraburkholderia aspalathi]|uniref:hypothetical protein n=1 Tax=Paraburkholderia aspalathi TaxID=1324617 RepID=UPI001BA8163D|nr:hypothetical protein [Paraburkholderia aspalathi]
MKTTTSLGVDYKKANQAAVDAVAAEEKQSKRVRRIGAVVAYIDNPNLDVNVNINKKDIDGSFINFVCTGADDFEVSSAGLRYTSDYANIVNSITATPDNSISGYLKALNGLKGEGKVLAMPAVSTNQFQSCRIDVSSYVPPKGFTAATAKQESPVLLIEAVIKAIETLNTIVDDGLKMATEAEQKRVLEVFINKNRENYSDVLSLQLSSDELEKAFARRKAMAIALPYYEFVDMMNQSPTGSRSTLLRQALQVHEDLSEYDQIRLAKSPAKIADQFSVINKRLDDYAQGKMTLSDLKAFLSETAAELQQTQKDYDTFSTAKQAATAAAKK